LCHQHHVDEGHDDAMTDEMDTSTDLDTSLMTLHEGWHQAT
jgi:hypothetical protein